MREPPFSPNALFFFLLFPHPHFAPRLPSAFLFFSPTFPLPLITNILFLVKRVISGISGQWTTRTKIVKTNGIPPSSPPSSPSLFFTLFRSSTLLFTSFLPYFSIQTFNLLSPPSHFFPLPIFFQKARHIPFDTFTPNYFIFLLPAPIFILLNIFLRFSFIL
ncbi:unnamed protein product [Meloidogyne enterolobii]|uniref:Uncharacterized protein n=1 Tax=Meloidogyne enterolobii TaxID=390850 RepID=A0ACB0XWY7_MELEN